MSKKDLSPAQYRYAIQTGDWESGRTFEMVKSEILARHEELLIERGNLFNEVMNASEPRKIEIKAQFDATHEELKDLLKKMRELYV